MKWKGREINISWPNLMLFRGMRLETLRKPIKQQTVSEQRFKAGISQILSNREMRPPRDMQFQNILS